MSHVKTVRVSHLGGIDAGYQMPYPYNPKKPTLVLINSITTTSDLYMSQFKNKDLAYAANLLAIEPLGHGKTRSECESFTYWDSAIMSLQVLESLGIRKAFVLGTNQGGWIAMRMVLLAPKIVEGVVVLGSSMDYESERTRKLGCWNAIETYGGHIKMWTLGAGEASPADFELDSEYCDFLIDSGFGKDCDKNTREFWRKTIKTNYQGDDGRRRARMAAVNMRERDGLHGRLSGVVSPVLWMHGTNDVVYSIANAEEEIKLFTGSKKAELHVIDGGQNLLNVSHPAEINAAVVGFLEKWKGQEH